MGASAGGTKVRRVAAIAIVAGGRQVVNCATVNMNEVHSVVQQGIGNNTNYISPFG